MPRLVRLAREGHQAGLAKLARQVAQALGRRALLQLDEQHLGRVVGRHGFDYVGKDVGRAAALHPAPRGKGVAMAEAPSAAGTNSRSRAGRSRRKNDLGVQDRSRPRAQGGASTTIVNAEGGGLTRAGRSLAVASPDRSRAPRAHARREEP
jgi:hypothetical protein